MTDKAFQKRKVMGQVDEGNRGPGSNCCHVRGEVGLSLSYMLMNVLRLSNKR